MITAVVGKTFLDAYNAKYSKALSPKEFFEQEYWELFFNHPKYMQWVTNSPFVQMKSGQKPHLLGIEERQEKLENLFAKVDEGSPDASFALGFPASELKEYASTSGLVSDIEIPTVDDDVYLSWIGSGLGIGVAGGFSILFNDPNITMQTFEGWKVYRKYLDDILLKDLRGNQINTWNGQWLTYSFDKKEFRVDYEFSDLEDQKIFNRKTGLMEVNTVNWSNLFFSLSQQLPEKELMGYVYGFGQTNKTIGFIPFQFKSGKTLLSIYKKLFEARLTDTKQFESLFGMHIKRACELGSIGIQALRPDGLKKLMDQGKTIKFKKEEDTINYHASKTWLVAMLSKNKEEITDYTLELAKLLQRYRAGGTKLDRKTLLEKELFVSGSKKPFIEALIKMVKDLEGEDLQSLKKLKDEVHLMSNEEFGYFSTLLKFDYAFVEQQS